MNEGLEVWIPPESVPSVRGLEAQPIRPLMEVTLPGYTPSSTSGNSQISASSSRLKELQDRLQLRRRNDSKRQERPSRWRDHPVRSVIIASYKKKTDGRYHRHNRWIGPRHNGREGIASMMRLVPNITHSREYQKVRST